jgi:hypothetical protein
VANQNLTKDRLATSEGVLSVGILAVKELQEKGFVTLFLNKDGEVEFCPRDEIVLDLFPEDQAISLLVEKGYSNSQLTDYLKGRDARKEKDG